MALDLKKLFPSSKFQTAEELKTKENEFSVGDRVKVANNIRCRQHGQTGTIVRIDPEDNHGWKSFIVKFDDEKYNSMGFNSGDIDKINEKENTMKKLNENQKVTLTFGQLKKLVKEDFDEPQSNEPAWTRRFKNIGNKALAHYVAPADIKREIDSFNKRYPENSPDKVVSIGALIFKGPDLDSTTDLYSVNYTYDGMYSRDLDEVEADAAKRIEEILKDPSMAGYTYLIGDAQIEDPPYDYDFWLKIR